ncbi:hypothetical protein L0F63_001772 [Massospora cicadina]|nr:hypothetical protein L0F63_001772 [Massospora cicadina]
MAGFCNENNVDYISYYLRRVITGYEHRQFSRICRGIQWLVAGWSVQRTAELLIKLFYHWGIGDAKFAGLVTQITRQWPVAPDVVDLVVTLVIGERSNKAARFIYHLTATWDARQIAELVGAIGIRLRWSERYFKHFLLQFACLGSRSWEKKRGLVYAVRHRFNSRSLLLQHAAILTDGANTTPPPCGSERLPQASRHRCRSLTFRPSSTQISPVIALPLLLYPEPGSSRAPPEISRRL